MLYLCTSNRVINYSRIKMKEKKEQIGEIVMYQPDETIRLEVRMENETVWLTQQQMAELFGTKRQAITKHLQNIYDSEELKREATSSILELVRKEGKRTVKRHFNLYNDVVYLFGASLKDAGKKLFAYIKMQETPAAELLNNIK